MPRNFGSNFLRGFGGTFPQTFNTSYRYGLQKQEDEIEKQKKQEYQKQQQDVLSQLILGKPSVNFTPGGLPMPKLDKLTENEKANLIIQADGSTLSRYNTIQSVLNPPKKKKEYYQFNNKLYEKDETGGIDISKPIAEEDKKPEKIWIKDERIGDKNRKLMGVENPNADLNDPNTRVVNGKKYTVQDYTVYDIYEKKTDGDGNKIAEGVKKSFSEYFKKQQELLATTKAGIKKIKAQGLDEDSSDVNELLTDHNKIYNEYVDNNMTESAVNWYKNTYNEETDVKAKGNPHPEDYFRKLQYDYINGNLGTNKGKRDEWEDVDFEILLEKFKAIYGFDPKITYQ